jgi:superfamily II DNA or RNA helicase
MNNTKQINLLDHQIEHYNNILKSIKKYSRALDSSDTGTGKTFVSLKVSSELKLIPWVICPKSVVPSWTKIIKTAGITKYHVITYDQLALSKELIKKMNDDYEWELESNKNFKGIGKTKYLFIFDEAHKCKNSNTINSKIMVSLAKHPVNILLLSATIIDKPLFFIPFGMVLKLYKTIQEGMDWMSNVINKKASNPMFPIHEILFNEYASRMRIDDTINVFKDNKIIFEGIEMKNYWEIEKKYDKINLILEQNKLNKKNKNKLDDAEVIESKDDKKGKGIGYIQKIRQEIEFLRVDKIHELALKYLDENKSVAIFVNFTDTIKELCKRLKTNCIIWGSQTIKERTKSIEDFCSDDSRIIICNIQSGSAGISLHDTIGTYPRVSIISPTWSAQDLIQVLGRIHRAMGKTDCLQQIIFCKGTIEESVGNVIKQKINNIRIFNDGNKQLKNDNMEVILNNELIKKKKVQETNEYIYKINDFDAIQNRIDNLEYKYEKIKKELQTYDLNSSHYNECEFRLRNIKKELDFNLNLIDKTIDNLMNI